MSPSLHTLVVELGTLKMEIRMKIGLNHLLSVPTVGENFQVQTASNLRTVATA